MTAVSLSMDIINPFLARLRDEWPAEAESVAHLPLLGDWKWAIIPPVAYLVAIVVLRNIMASRKAIEVPKWFQALHNG